MGPPISSGRDSQTVNIQNAFYHHVHPQTLVQLSQSSHFGGKNAKEKSGGDGEGHLRCGGEKSVNHVTTWQDNVKKPQEGVNWSERSEGSAME